MGACCSSPGQQQTPVQPVRGEDGVRKESGQQQRSLDQPRERQERQEQQEQQERADQVVRQNDQKSSHADADAGGHRQPKPEQPKQEEQQRQQNAKSGKTQRDESRNGMGGVSSETLLSSYQHKFLYNFGPVLGSGHFAEVRLCQNRETGEQFAVKIMDKDGMLQNYDQVLEEINMLRRVSDHPNVVRLVDAFQDEDFFYLVMELCGGGDLFSRIIQEGRFTEARCAEIVRQMASALKHAHKHNVVHRDLKPENILMASDSADAEIKVGDFGLSKVVKPGSMMKTVCGTWAYCAPEVIGHTLYTEKIDNWTLGVLMFVLLAGFHPFDEYGDSPDVILFQNIRECNYSFDDEAWDSVSDEPKRLIEGLLQVDPDKRMTLDEVLASPWVQGRDVSQKNISDATFDKFKRFATARAKFIGQIGAVKAARKWITIIEKDGVLTPAVKRKRKSRTAAAQATASSTTTTTTTSTTTTAGQDATASAGHQATRVKFAEPSPTNPHAINN